MPEGPFQVVRPRAALDTPETSRLYSDIAYGEVGLLASDEGLAETVVQTIARSNHAAGNCT